MVCPLFGVVISYIYTLTAPYMYTLCSMQILQVQVHWSYNIIHDNNMIIGYTLTGIYTLSLVSTLASAITCSL